MLVQLIMSSRPRYWATLLLKLENGFTGNCIADPIQSLYGIFTSNVGKHTIHGCYGDVVKKHCTRKVCCFFCEETVQPFFTSETETDLVFACCMGLMESDFNNKYYQLDVLCGVFCICIHI